MTGPRRTRSATASTVSTRSIAPSSRYCRIADHFAQDGFYPKAAALYKKSLKIKPDDERALQQSAEIAVRQGLLVEAKQHFAALAERRRGLGDPRGAADALLRLGSLDPDDLASRLAGARAVAAAGDGARIVGEFRAIADAFAERGERDRALEVLAEAAAVAPDDATIRAALVSQYAAAGDVARAREFADTPSEFVALADVLEARGDRQGSVEMVERALSIAPGERSLAERIVRGYGALGVPDRARAYLDALGDITEPDLLRLAAELRAEAGEHEASRSLFARLLAREPHRAASVAARGAELASTHAEAALVYVESAADTFLLHGDFASAAGTYQAFLQRRPGHVGASLRLVEICVDGELGSLGSAQAALVDAYLSEGRGAEARAVAEDLVGSNPGDASQVARLRRALELSGEPDVERVLAERVSAGPMNAAEPALDLTDDELVFPAASAAPERPPAAVPATAATGTAPPGAPKGQPRPSVAGDPFRLGPIAIDLGDILGDELEAASGGHGGEKDAEIDLNDALAGLRGAPPKGPAAAPTTLEGVFAEFRDEVTRHTQSDAAEQHFKVGLTYEEMGMVPEAMKELEIAVRAPRLRFEAASRLARLSLKSGRPVDAVEWFERAAEAPPPPRMRAARSCTNSARRSRPAARSHAPWRSSSNCRRTRRTSAT